MHSDKSERKMGISVPPAIATAIAPLIRALRDDVAGGSNLLDEHLEAYEELLPHLLFGELVGFLQESSSDASDADRIARPAAAALEKVLASLVGVDPKDPWREYFDTLLWTSFFENFEPFGPEFENVRREFGPLLEAEYQGYMHATRPQRASRLESREHGCWFVSCPWH